MAKSERIEIRVSPAEKDQIRAKADARGVRVSDWVRGAALTALDRVAEDPAAEPVIASPASTPCPYTAKQLVGKTNGAYTEAACQRHIAAGTWRSLL